MMRLSPRSISPRASAPGHTWSHLRPRRWSWCRFATAQYPITVEVRHQVNPLGACLNPPLWLFSSSYRLTPKQLGVVSTRSGQPSLLMSPVAMFESPQGDQITGSGEIQLAVVIEAGQHHVAPESGVGVVLHQPEPASAEIWNVISSIRLNS